MAPLSDDAMPYIILASKAKGEQHVYKHASSILWNVPLSAHHETPRSVCIMPVVDGFGLALQVMNLRSDEFKKKKCQEVYTLFGPGL